jgi:hypothetical protein
MFQGVVDSCKSPVTRNSYTRALHYFMDYLRIPRDNYSKLLEKDPKLIQMDIRDLNLRTKDLSYATVASYVAALNKFYIQNYIIE